MITLYSGCHALTARTEFLQLPWQRLRVRHPRQYPLKKTHCFIAATCFRCLQAGSRYSGQLFFFAYAAGSCDFRPAAPLVELQYTLHAGVITDEPLEIMSRKTPKSEPFADLCAELIPASRSLNAFGVKCSTVLGNRTSLRIGTCAKRKTQRL